MKFIILILTIFIYGCNNEEALSEKTEIETKERIQEQNANIEQWSNELNRDLKKKRKFTSAVSGKYEGELVIEDKRFFIKLKVTSPLPDYDPNRRRRVEELVWELQNLTLDFQVLQWSPESDLSATGCIFKKVRPNFENGRLNLVSDKCNISYQFYLTNRIDTTLEQEALTTNSKKLIKQLYKGELNYVDVLQGVVQSNSNAKEYKTVLRKN